MDLSSVKRGPLTAGEKERKNKLSLCRYCGQPDHIAEDYNDSNILLAKRRAAGAAGIHEMTMVLSKTLENTRSPSIVTLGDHSEKNYRSQLVRSLLVLAMGPRSTL